MVLDTPLKPSSDVAVILGNGPSLRGFDFAKELAGVDVFGMNAACRYWHTIGWYPLYYASVDPVFGFSFKEEIAELVHHRESYGIKAFLLRQNVVAYMNIPDASEYIINYDFWLLKNKYHRLMQATSTTTGAMSTLWAASLGYKHIILLGMDAHLPTTQRDLPVIENDALATTKDSSVKKVQIEDPSGIRENHFFDGYHKKGDKLFVPGDSDKRTENQLQYEAWLFIPEAMQKLDVEIINANPASKIDMFPKNSWSEAKAKFSLG